MAKTAFEQWFEAQYGPRRLFWYKWNDSKLRDHRLKLRHELMSVEEELAYRTAWDQKMGAARYTKEAAPDFTF